MTTERPGRGDEEARKRRGRSAENRLGPESPLFTLSLIEAFFVCFFGVVVLLKKLILKINAASTVCFLELATPEPSR